MRKYLLALALILTSTVTHAQNYADLTWVAPTEQLTGVRLANGQCEVKPIPATGPEALAGFRVVYNTSIAALNLPPPDTDCGATKHPEPTGTLIILNDPNATALRITNLAAGTYYFMIAAVNNAGAVSYFTGPGSKTIEYVPTFSTTVPDVYNVVKRDNGFALIRVGTVPLNTLCDKTQTVNGKYAVPVSAVTWSGTVRTIVVVGTCSEH